MGEFAHSHYTYEKGEQPAEKQGPDQPGSKKPLLLKLVLPNASATLVRAAAAAAAAAAGAAKAGFRVQLVDMQLEATGRAASPRSQGGEVKSSAVLLRTLASASAFAPSKLCDPAEPI